MSYNDIEFDYQYMSPNDRIEIMDEGEGMFRIAQVVPKVSKSGNKMLEVMFKVRDRNGREWHIYDYLIATIGDEAGMKRLNTKIGNIAKAIGKPEIDDPAYNKRGLINDLLGCSGKCYVKIQEDKTGKYFSKNVISKFYPHGDVEKKDYSEGLDDESLPF